MFCLILFICLCFNEAVVHCPGSLVFKEVAICLPLHQGNNFPLISQSMLMFYLWGKSSPQIKCCFNLVHTIKLCVKFCSYIFKSKEAILMGLNVSLLPVFTLNGFLIRLILSKIFLNTCEIHEDITPVLNIAVNGSVLRIWLQNLIIWVLHIPNLR